MVGRFLVCAMVACGQPEAPVKPVEITPVQIVPDAVPSDAPDPLITVSARKQMFTTKSGPGHVWFDITNKGAAASVDVVSLEYVDTGIASQVAITWVRHNDTNLPGVTFTAAPGDSVLDLGFDTTMIPRDRDAYMFRVNVKVDGVAISGESTIQYARRIPVRP